MLNIHPRQVRDGKSFMKKDEWKTVGIWDGGKPSFLWVSSSWHITITIRSRPLLTVRFISITDPRSRICTCGSQRNGGECCLFDGGSKPDGKVWETAALDVYITSAYAHKSVCAAVNRMVFLGEGLMLHWCPNAVSFLAASPAAGWSWEQGSLSWQGDGGRRTQGEWAFQFIFSRFLFSSELCACWVKYRSYCFTSI